MLATHFLKGYVTKYRKAITGFSDAALKALLDYPWPGNVRQLDHAIERAVLMAQRPLLAPSDLGLQPSDSSGPRFEHMTLDQIERWAVRKAFDRYEGDISKAAQALGLSRAALYRRIEKHQIDLAPALSPELQCLLAALGGKDPIAAHLKRRPCKVSDRALVIHYEDRLLTA